MKKKKINLLEVDEETMKIFFSIFDEEESDYESSFDNETEDKEFLNVAQNTYDSCSNETIKEPFTYATISL